LLQWGNPRSFAIKRDRRIEACGNTIEISPSADIEFRISRAILKTNTITINGGLRLPKNGKMVIISLFCSLKMDNEYQKLFITVTKR
jgi:hypothetical protein